YQDNFFVSWLDGRNTVGDEEERGAMTVRAAVVAPDGEKLEEWELDSRVCDCCQTTAAITDDGPIVAYRDRSAEEIRDMSIVRYVNGSWTEPTVIHEDNWKIAGCPVNGPRLSAVGNHVAVGWFTAADGKPSVNVKFSEDGGASFGEIIKVSEGNTIGRVDVEMLDKNTAIVSWMEGADIKAALLNIQGDIIATHTIASTSASRSSGFPQMTKAGDQIIFAWTNPDEQEIRTTMLILGDY
ncbi:MAG: exo-alpha-sialidase, partial [Fulvivirga sp.]|nr:exo-alpha-sialidase [Fulvivirga sp.]